MKALTRNLLTFALCSGFIFVAASPAAADDDDDDPDPDQQDAKCGQVVAATAKAAAQETKEAVKKNAGELQAQFKDMRSACSALRACKKDCRGEKRECKQKCKSLKGPKKRACKRACRGEKASCKSDCRSELAQGQCKAARKKFWGTVKGTLAEAGKAAVKSNLNDLKTSCNPLYKQD